MYEYTGRIKIGLHLEVSLGVTIQTLLMFAGVFEAVGWVWLVVAGEFREVGVLIMKVCM